MNPHPVPTEKQPDHPPAPLAVSPPPRELYRCKIAGIPHRIPDFASFCALHGLKEGDSVTLVAEPHNPYDPNAIKVMWKEHHLGYVPKVETIHLRHYPQMRVVTIQPTVKWNECHIEEVA